MRYLISCLGTLLCLLLLSRRAVEQITEHPQAAPPEAKLTFDQLTQAAKVYFRDTAEFPLLQTTTLTVSDASGHVGKAQTVSLNYIFQGYSQKQHSAHATLKGKTSPWAVLRGNKMAKVAGSSAFWSMMPGVRLYSYLGEYSFEVERTSSSGLFTAKLAPVTPCSALPMKHRGVFYFPNVACGISEFQLQSDLSFQKFVFDASGLPVLINVDPIGQCSLERYHVEIDFQKIYLPGEKEPFLVPQQVLVTLETDKGRIEIASTYEPKRHR